MSSRTVRGGFSVLVNDFYDTLTLETRRYTQQWRDDLQSSTPTGGAGASAAAGWEYQDTPNGARVSNREPLVASKLLTDRPRTSQQRNLQDLWNRGPF